MLSWLTLAMCSLVVYVAPRQLMQVEPSLTLEVATYH